MLEDNNISLRLLEESDLDFLYSIENDPSNKQFNEDSQYFSKHTLKKYIKNSTAGIEIFGQLRFVISLENKPIGLIDLFEYNALLKQAGIGIFILNSFRNQQYGYKALNLLISYSWNNLDLFFLFANIKKNNMLSLNLFTKSGFSYINDNLYQLSR
ncbi:MAG: GNAT family N-acetyltransferase [Flavobacteriales bacterium]|jgi:diamine N-acetyltransferase